ncbi:MAG: M12 family metallo-peptidase [Planctomycetota bacterium]|nr:M12 family metallo-peptidase [Planctomycetota bacterium]
MRSLVALSGFAVCAAAQSLPFPLVPIGDELVPDTGVMEALRPLERAVVGPVTLPGGREVHFELVRVAKPFQDTVIHVNGAPTDMKPDARVSLWRAAILGQPGSSGFFGFSPRGSRGWIRGDGELHHLVAYAGEGGDWSASRSRLVSQEWILDQGYGPTLECEVDAFGGDITQVAQKPSGGTIAGGALVPILECRIAVESDYQYYQVFGDLGAATDYLVMLFGAASDRYREQIGTILTANYMGFYTNPADPWTAQDVGGSCIDVLYEFQAAWKFGGGPVTSDLYHLVSGASLGCGVAWLPGLCDQEYGFAVSGNIHGQTPIPIIPHDPLNWDFMVFTHETGHNFGTPHTHDFCPPVDECAPSGYWGSCQDEQACITDGTLMSYCHLCDGGYTNITTYFHPIPADTMRSYAEGSCLQPFEGVFTTNLGFSKPGSGGDPLLEVTWDVVGDAVEFLTSNTPASDLGVIVGSFAGPVYTPLYGGTLVPSPDIIKSINSDAAGTSLLTAPVAPGFAPAGAFFWAQTWFLDGGAYAASNGVEVELIVP